MYTIYGGHVFLDVCSGNVRLAVEVVSPTVKHAPFLALKRRQTVSSEEQLRQT